MAGLDDANVDSGKSGGTHLPTDEIQFTASVDLASLRSVIARLKPILEELSDDPTE